MLPVIVLAGAWIRGLGPTRIRFQTSPLSVTPATAAQPLSTHPSRSLPVCHRTRTVHKGARRSRSAPFEQIILRAAKETGLDPYLIRAVITAESQFNVREVSPAGACGLMQLMPRTARLFAVKDIFDPEENIRAGCKHLRYLMHRFSNNLALTLAAYNAGEVPVLRYKGIPPFPETQNYVRHVLRLYSTTRNT